MESKKLRVCEVNHGSHFSICELRYDDINKYFIRITEDPEGLFADFNITIKQTVSEKDVIKRFQLQCLNRFTCNGEFTLEFIEENNQEFIRFY